MPGRLERNKDVAQELVESGAQHVGRIAQIVTDAVVDVTRELGSLASDVFELREASERARLDAEGGDLDGDGRDPEALADDDLLDDDEVPGRAISGPEAPPSA